jgi:ketosteroid isomerase-like protein
MRVLWSSSKDATPGIYKETGKSLDAQVCHVLTFRDGKLASF